MASKRNQGLPGSFGQLELLAVGCLAPSVEVDVLRVVVAENLLASGTGNFLVAEDDIHQLVEDSSDLFVEN